MMRRIKFFVAQGIMVLLLFFWEIGSIFSDRKSPHPVQTNESKAISHRIENHMSAFEGTEDMDRAIAGFLDRYQIKGASVAMTKDGRLVYAKGFGYADEEKREMMEPRHVFRIASVSKLITAVAVMHLVEEGRIDLDSRVFGPEGILNDSIYLDYRDGRVEEITIHLLLKHKAGWSRYYGDPMFMPHVVSRRLNVDLPLKTEHVICYALRQKLNYHPGTRYSYSNLGYVILGEVIEKVTGMEYEDYVQYAILHPLDIHDMRIGKGYHHQRAENEVKYYEVSGSREVLAFDSHESYVPRVYGGNDIELLGAAGGWIASPAELLKLVVAIDGFNTSPDLLMPETIKTMADTRKSRYDMIGWKGTDGRGTWWRTGTLTGTSALLVRQQNGINWIIVTNTTTWKRARIHSITSRTMFQAISSVSKWPEYDLFDNSNTPLTSPNYMAHIE